MLQIMNIKKKYVTGGLVQTALDGVCLNFRDSEFVAVLGPSGSGKTTLLNVIGGLDRYDSGDLVINGVSTKQYSDADWDSYRNHTIGFVFQSYNLIPHQSVLANVELALTISGISRTERRNRAKQALEKVGLGDQVHKKPNQMSGGQMQRVAIARALVNDPDILLADEPTGALDTDTGIQVMDLLKEVAKDRLVVMVTHNPDLADKYATRTVRLQDGRITGDTNPYVPEDEAKEPVHRNMGKAKMSFLTSLSLSFNNLRTKKGRTVLTSFAGSIGIIGIALILALSTGVNDYIASIQKDTMTSYPVTINSQTFDLNSFIGISGQTMGNASDKPDKELEDVIYADSSRLMMSENLMSSIAENNLTAFKKYLDNPESEMHRYIGENGIVYSYSVAFSVYSFDKDGVLVRTDAETSSSAGGAQGGFGGMGSMSTLFGAPEKTGAQNFYELMAGKDTLVSAVITDSYTFLAGSWPSSYDEVVLVLDENNSIPTSVLYQLGFISEKDYRALCDSISEGETQSELKFDCNEALGHVFYMVPACDTYMKNEDGTFTYAGEDAVFTEQSVKNALQLKISGVVKPVKDAANAIISSSVAYTSALTDYIIEHTAQSDIVVAQEASKDVNVLTGLVFSPADNAQKAQDAIKYISTLNVSSKASLYKIFMAGAPSNPNAMPSDEQSMAAALDMWLEMSPDENVLAGFYDKYISGASYENNMASFGKVSYDAPSSISIYSDSFEAKDAISQCINNYNNTVGEDDRITYVDYVALLTSSLTSMVDVVSYVLIAFVAVSLIVSCIMIGIITHISVLERTKEIGILRAIGASKRNISQVFNAETFIIGLLSGALGVIISSLLTFPINSLIASLVADANIKAVLPVGYAAVLVVISVLITVLGGLIPAKKAAKKDPVIALRTE